MKSINLCVCVCDALLFCREIERGGGKREEGGGRRRESIPGIRAGNGRNEFR